MIRIIRVGLAGLLAALTLAAPAWAAEAVGDWLGTLKVTPTVELRIALHIKQGPDGALGGVWDSVDQGLFDDALSQVKVTGDALSFHIASLNADWVGAWNPATHHWDGQWSQAGHAFPLDFAQGIAPPPPPVSGLDGEWDGTLNMGQSLLLRLAVHVRTGPRGTVATIDSVDQGSYGVRLSSLTREGEHVRMENKLAGYVIAGDLTRGGTTLSATFTQGGQTLPLTLTRLAEGAPSPWPAPKVAPAAPAPAPTGAAWTVPTDTEIRALLKDRIDVQHQGVGIVVGVITPQGRRVVAYGRSDAGDPRPLDGDTEFEIGSITKVFTALVLADMANKGEVGLLDPVGKYLPPGVHAPERNGKTITLEDLATHTSGLPRLPTNMSFRDPANPYADYTVEQLHQFLSGYALPRDPGASWEYSNLGFGLLGHALSLKAGQDYETLVKTRVLKPLGMNSTTITLTSEERARLAIGHDSGLHKVENWDLPTLAGAGALRSTANDLLTFLAANMGYADTPLKRDMETALSVRRPMASPGSAQALGWEVVQTRLGQIVEHGGGTGGYHTLIAYDPATRVGVVILTNAETVTGADDIGLHILVGAPVATLAPPPPPAAERAVVVVSAEALDRLVGRYQLAPGVLVTITREGAHLMAEITGQPAYEIFPESPSAFFWTVVDAQASFTLGPDGHASGLVLHQNGRDLPAPRVP